MQHLKSVSYADVFHTKTTGTEASQTPGIPSNGNNPAPPSPLIRGLKHEKASAPTGGSDYSHSPSRAEPDSKPTVAPAAAAWVALPNEG